jgi:hypothetical protein
MGDAPVVADPRQSFDQCHVCDLHRRKLHPPHQCKRLIGQHRKWQMQPVGLSR